MFYPKFILFLGKTSFMKPAQNFKNHPQLVKGFHGLLFLSILALLGGSVSYLFLAEEGTHLPGYFIYTNCMGFYCNDVVHQTVSAQSTG